MKKQIVIFFFIVCLTGTISAQEFTETGFIGGGGMTLIKSKTDKNIKSGGFSYDFGIDYTYFLTSQWGASLGINFNAFSGKTTLSNFYDSYNIDNPAYKTNEGYYFSFTAEGENYTEKQQSMFLSIPVLAVFRSGGGRNYYNTYVKPGELNLTFYGTTGVKILLPFSGKYEGNFDKLTTSGYSEYTNQTHTDEPEYGFATYHNLQTNGSLNLKTGLDFYLEGGVEWAFSNERKLYTGIYFDSALTSIYKNTDPHLVQYQTSAPDKFVHASVLNTYNKFNGISFGIKLKFALNSGSAVFN